MFIVILSSYHRVSSLLSQFSVSNDEGVKNPAVLVSR